MYIVDIVHPVTTRQLSSYHTTCITATNNAHGDIIIYSVTTRQLSSYQTTCITVTNNAQTISHYPRSRSYFRTYVYIVEYYSPRYYTVQIPDIIGHRLPNNSTLIVSLQRCGATIFSLSSRICILVFWSYFPRLFIFKGFRYFIPCMHRQFESRHHYFSAGRFCTVRIEPRYLRYPI